MRTTLTLEDDVARLLEKASRETGASFKETVNHFLRQGLIAGRQPAARPFSVIPRHLGLPAGLTYDDTEQLLESLEGPLHR